MKFRNYCLVVMGNMEAVKDDIIKIAESKPRYLDAKGILIATFASVAEPNELRDFFNFNGRSFFLFDLNTEFSGYHLDNQKLHSHLFDYLVNQDENLKEMSEKLMSELSATTNEDLITKSSKIKGIHKNKYNYSNLTKKERDNLVNDILDKYNTIGIDKINDSDKIILQKISELK